MINQEIENFHFLTYIFIMFNFFKTIFLFFKLKRKEKNYRRYKKMLDSLKNYSKDHKKLIDFLRENLRSSYKEFYEHEKKAKILKNSENRIKELRKNIKFMRKSKRGREIYETLMKLLGIHSREIFFIRKYFDAVKNNDYELANYYLFVLDDLFKKDEKASEEFIERVENFIKGPIL